MTCRVSRVRLSSFLDGELGWFGQLRLGRHLRHCAECRDRLSELKAADALIHLTRDRGAPARRRPGLPGRLQVEHSLPRDMVWIPV